jgi:heme/copper-type cytochrome/quinol oxidase subunit 2
MGCLVAYILVGLVVWLFSGMILDCRNDYGTRRITQEYPYLLALICILGWPLVVPSVIIFVIGYILYRAYQEGAELYRRIRSNI